MIAESPAQRDSKKRRIHPGFVFIVVKIRFGDTVPDGGIGFVCATLRIAGAVQKEDQRPLSYALVVKMYYSCPGGAGG